MGTNNVDIVQPNNMTDSNSDSFEYPDGEISSVISWLDDDPDLQSDDQIYTVDTENVKKYTAKDLKRQNNIWELINTEKQYVKRLKIMQKIFAHSMVHNLNYTEDLVDRLFPRLDELVELHAKFLRKLLSRQARNEDRSVDEIGDVLLDQFQGITADKMKSVYGVFCSKHTEAMQLYKEFLKSDRKFQAIAKFCNNLPVCEKREISDFILGVTVRLSKYPILIESILKNTTDKKDRENLSHALQSCKDVVQHVDGKVAAYGKLVDIQSKLESKTVAFKGSKFKRQDLNAKNRELVHAGKIGWKSARGRVYDVLAVVLTDLLVFLQKNEQKYTFFLQDKKSCVIPLHDLVVREKRDVRSSLGIYIISQNRVAPEMYELVCQSKKERKEWVRILQDAVRVCPPDVEPEVLPSANLGVALSKELDKHTKIDHADKVKHIIEQLHHKDDIIRECCDEKNKLMLELLELTTPSGETGSRPNSQEIDSLIESVEIVHAAIQEASRLTDILQGTGTQMSRSISSFSDHQSIGHAPTSVPRRAETFSGFDSSHDFYKTHGLNQRFAGIRQESVERPPDSVSLSQQDRDRSYSHTVDAILESKHDGDIHPWKKRISSDLSSDQGSSLEELSAASVSSLIPTTTAHEQMTSIYHLVQYLNALMNLTSKQCTKVESLRAELAEAKEEIAKLSADVHNNRSVYRHDQLEELRNLQENINQEKQEWERIKLRDRSRLEREREMLENEWKEMEKERKKLRTLEEELKREREILQQQMNIMREQGFKISSSLDDSFREVDPVNTSGDAASQQPRTTALYRSASADFCDIMALDEDEDIESTSPYSWETINGFSHQPRPSVGSLQDQGSSPASSAEQLRFPVHVMDTHNEQRVSDKNYQTSPLKNVGPTNIYANPFQTHHPSAKVSLPPSFFGAPNHFPSQASSSGVSRVQSMSAVSRAAMKQGKTSRSAPSDLAKMVKFAEPQGRVSFSALPEENSRSSLLSNKPHAAPQASDVLGGSVRKEARKKPERIIYL